MDAIAVLIAVVTLLLTVTGTVGGLGFATWAGGDRLWAHLQPVHRLRRLGPRRRHHH